MERDFETLEILLFLTKFPPDFSITWWLPEPILTSIIARCWFYDLSTPTFISSNAAMRESLSDLSLTVDALSPFSFYLSPVWTHEFLFYSVIKWVTVHYCLSLYWCPSFIPRVTLQATSCVPVTCPHQVLSMSLLSVTKRYSKLAFYLSCCYPRS